MFLKSIELKGFKSFADRTHIDFLDGVTCIVGPNGCGKSNIIDAIRWVLGEQSSSTLRARRMEDVIFSGTKHRSAQNLASVRLIFSDAKELSPGGLEELSIERILHRSGESTYKINSQAVRLKDLRQLFMDTAIGVSGYSLISQGDIDDILKENKEERRKIFEEASGISLLHYKKEEARRRLLRVEDHYLRMMDIVGELEERREPLLVEKEKALQYLDLSRRAKEMDLYYAHLDYRRYEEQQEELSRELGRLNYTLHHVSQKREEALEKRRELEEKSESSQQQFDLLQDLLREKTKTRDEAYVDIRVKEERQAHLRRELSSLQEEGQIDPEEETELKDKLTASEEKLSQVKEKSLVAKDRLDQQRREESLRGKTMEELEQRKEDLRLQKQRLETEALHKGTRLGEVVARQDKLLREEQSLLEDKKALLEEKEDLQKEKSSLERKSLRHTREGTELTREHKEAEEERSYAKTRIAELQSHLSSLDKNIQLYESWEKESLQDLEEGKSALGGELLLRKLKPKKGYERALEAALGQGLYGLDMTATAPEQWQDKVASYPINLLYAHASFPKSHDAKSLGTLAEFVKGTGAIQEHLLSSILVYENLEDALAGPEEAIRVTLAGQRLEKGFYYGSLQTASPLEISLNLHEAREEREKLLLEKESLEKELEEKNVLLGQLEKNRESWKAQEDSLQGEIKGLEGKLHELSGRESLLLFRENQMKETMGADEGQRDLLEKELEKNKKELAKLLLLEEELEDKVPEDLPEESSSLFEDYMALQLDEARLEEEKRRWKESLEAYYKRREDIEKKNKLLMEQRKLTEQEAKKLQEELDEEREAHSSILLEIKELDEKAMGIKRELDSFRTEIMELQRSREEEEERFLQLKDQISKKEVQHSRLEERMNGLTAEIWERYELSMLQVKDLGISCDEPRSQRKKIRQAMINLEPVNLQAPQEFQEVDERYQFLTEQLRDVEASKKDIESTMNSLEKRMRQDFSETFVAIRENFKEIFSNLFRGGQGDILLEDPEDVLGSDILILASPPGKKLQHMNLLSGGEKALTAIALLFAVLKTKPAPFYVLDEIEAALDDINIQRFGTFLEDFSVGSQFILITHRKGTMEFANALYGVSMEEKGISTLVSLKMEEE